MAEQQQAMTTRMKRLHREWTNIQSAGLSEGTVRCEPKCGSALTEWEAVIRGPDKSPYEGGYFLLRMEFEENYPFKAPKIKFGTRVYHMNVSNSGDICLDLLKDKWCVGMTVSSLLVAIRSLLADPNPDDPLIPSLAAEYLSNQEVYFNKAKMWTDRFAQEIPKPAQ